MFERARRCVVALSIVAILIACLLPGTTAAAHSSVRLSAAGTAVVDGVMASGEWSTAARIDFQLNLPAGGTTPATLYVMNDATNLYLAVRIPGPPVGRGSVSFEFENDHDGVREQGDNIATVSATEVGGLESSGDGFRDNCGNPNPACGFLDTGVDPLTGRPIGGTTDMVGAVSHDGTATFFEYAVALDSADDAHDFSLHVGDTVGFTIWATFLGPFPLFAATFFPAHVAFPSEYGDITIASPDSTAPLINASVEPAANANGWHNTDVSITWDVLDPESGIAATSGCSPTTLSSETDGTTLTCSAQNGAGLTATESRAIRIDRTAPTITFFGNAGTYAVDQLITITCEAVDHLSGIATTTCPAVASGPASNYVGTTGKTSTTLQATAVDRADNVAAANTTFVVVVDAAGLCRLTASLAIRNALCNQFMSIAASSTPAAKAGKLLALDRLLAAQAGASIPAEDAELLGRLAKLL